MTGSSDPRRPTAPPPRSALPSPATARILAALCAGFGGLAFELAVVRRFGLLLGTTTAAATAVVAVFLAGLGLGGYLASRPGGRRGLRGAAVAYLGVAVWLAASGAILARLGPPPSWLGLVLLLATVGGPAVLMGSAFPRLFDAVGGRWAPAWLVAANLAGSVIAAWSVGNLLIAELGLDATVRIAAGCYLLAAALAAAGAPRGVEAEVTGVGALPAHAGAAWLVAGAGFLTLGYEVLLFRRLPFFLDGFQPTFAGVLTACLATLALGAVAAPVFGRGRAAAPRALVLAAVGAVLGLHESLAPALGRWPVGSDLGLHLRIAGTAALVTLLPLGAAGAVLPLSLARFEPADRGRIAGRLFLAQGLGILAGALCIGQLAPRLFPTSLFAVAAPLVALGALFALARVHAVLAAAGATAVVLLGLFGVAGAGTIFEPRPPVRGSRYDRLEAYLPIEHRSDTVTTASVVYDRAHHSMVLFTDEFRAAYTGPGTSYMKVLGHLPFLLSEGLREVAVIALGTGTTADAVRAWPDPERIHVVEISAAVLSLVDRFAGDGPVATGVPAPFRVDPRTEVHVADGRRWLATRPERSLDLVTMEPLLPYAPGTAPLYSAEFYALVRSRLRPGGLCVQWVPTHAMPRAMFETLLATFGEAFASTSVWLVDQSTLLVGWERPRQLPGSEALEARLAAAPALAARTLHEAGLCGVEDLRAAYLGGRPGQVFATAERLGDDRPFLERIGYWSGEERLGFFPDNLGALTALVRASAAEDGDGLGGGSDWIRLREERLGGLAARARAILDPTGAEAGLALARAARLRAAVPHSVLLHAEETLALRQAVLAEARHAPPRSAAALARRQVERDPGCAELLALRAADRAPDGPEAGAAVAAALAVDPTAAQRSPWAFAWSGDLAKLPRRSPLEDVGLLPEGRALAELASRGDPRGAAIRAVFPVRAGRALVELARSEALGPAARDALLAVLDPALFRAYGAAVAARSGDLVAEVLPLWRRDLPLTEPLAGLGAASAPGLRGAFAAALAERRGAAAVEALADLLVDPDREVRFAAAAAAFRTFGDALRFDPDGPESTWRRAAERLRALHNRPR
jgi:spermidine synthase